MTAYIVRRLLLMIPTLFGIMLINFVVDSAQGAVPKAAPTCRPASNLRFVAAGMKVTCTVKGVPAAFGPTMVVIVKAPSAAGVIVSCWVASVSPPPDARRVTSPWPISPSAPVIRTTGLRIGGVGPR